MSTSNSHARANLFHSCTKNFKSANPNHQRREEYKVMTILGSQKANCFFLALYTLGLFTISNSTKSRNPVLPLFAEKLGTTKYLMSLVAAASISGTIVNLPARLARQKLIRDL